MNRYLVRTLGIAWWLVPLAVAVAAIGVEVDWGRQWRRIAVPAAEVPPKPLAVAVLPDYAVAGGLAARPETTTRTLFNPTRRPAPVAAVEAPKATMKRGQFTLTGTMEIDGRSTAFLREAAGGKFRRVLQGETINGLLVAEVKRDRVRLALGEESEELVLRVATNPRSTQPPAARPPAAVPGQPPLPGAEAVPQPPATGQAAAPAPQPQDVAEMLGQRRRAVRAGAQAAVGAPAGATAGATAGTQSASQPDESGDWSQVHQQYQQRQR